MHHTSMITRHVSDSFESGGAPLLSKQLSTTSSESGVFLGQETGPSPRTSRHVSESQNTLVTRVSDNEIDTVSVTSLDLTTGVTGAISGKLLPQSTHSRSRTISSSSSSAESGTRFVSVMESKNSFIISITNSEDTLLGGGTIQSRAEGGGGRVFSKEKNLGIHHEINNLFQFYNILNNLKFSTRRRARVK